MKFGAKIQKKMTYARERNFFLYFMLFFCIAIVYSDYFLYLYTVMKHIPHSIIYYVYNTNGCMCEN